MDEALAYLSPITSQVQGMIDVVGSHPHFALLAVFLLALSEAVPVVGTVVPGSTLILAISALATAAGISPWALLVAAVVGAIAGDGFSFWLGHRYHRQILRRWPLNRFPRLIERVRSWPRPPRSLRGRWLAAIGLVSLAHDKTQPRRRYGVPTQPTRVRIRRPQICPAAPSPARPQWTARSLENL